MPLTVKHRTTFTFWWIIVFYLLALIKWMQGQWLYQLEPFMFSIRFDGITWLMMQSGLHIWIIRHQATQLIWDFAFYGFPLLYYAVFIRKPIAAARLAWIWLAVNWLYVQCYTLYPSNSIEGHVGWLLFPLLFCCSGMRSFYLVMHGLRYFFLYFFFSAGIWKLANGGAFAPAQMSAILLEQHKEFLVTSPGYWQSNLIRALINMPLTSFILYWMGLLAELSFATGFFTKRYDRALFVFFALFLIFDYLIMRIPYIEVSPFLLVLLYSHLGSPEGKYKVIGE